MKKLFTFFLVLFLIGININLQAQLTGTLTVPGNYPTIRDAITDLDTMGVGAGGVIFNVAAGHTETSSNMVISIITSPPTASNPVVFQKSGAGANPLITAAPGVSATLDGIIKFSGADYITFDGIDMVDPASNTGNAMMEWGYALMKASTTDGSQYNIIKNCTITLQKINTASVGIYIINKDTAGITVNGIDSTVQNNNNKFYGNTISNVYRGIQATSVSTVRDFDNEIGVIGQSPNTITNWGGSTVSCDGIRCESQSKVKVNNNVINGGNGTNGSVQITGILVTGLTTATARNYEISFNTVTVVCGNTSGALVVIRALGSGDVISVHDNIIENCNLGLNTASCTYLSIEPVGVINGGRIYNNIIRNNTSSGTGSATMITGGTGAMINNLEIYNNQIYGNQKSGISGSMVCISVDLSSLICYSNLIYNNSIPNTSGATVSSVYGYFNNANALTSENVYNNTIYKLSVGGSGSSTSTVVAGIRSSGNSTIKEIYGNTIDSLSTTVGRMTSGGVVGIYSTSGVTTKIYGNRIFDLSNTNSLGTAAGCWVTSGTSISIYNNFISNLKAPNSNDTNAVIGINSTSSAANTTIGIYYNSIQLAASGGTTFGSSGVSVVGNATATTAALDLRNNIIVNLSTPGNSGGKVVGYRRSNANLQNFTNTSNYNTIYIGTGASNKLIFSNGSGNDQTIAAYQTRVAPRETKAKSVAVNFTNTNLGDLHLTGSSIQDINLCGKPISGITDDYDSGARNSLNPYRGADESTAFPFKKLDLTMNLEVCPETDTIDVLIRSVSPPYEVIDSTRGLGGQGITQSLNFIKVENGVNYYLVIKHRNSIETWSKSGGEAFTSNLMTYDFTSAASQAYGNNMVLAGGDYSLYSGDVQQDGIIDASDIVAIYNDVVIIATGYIPTDLNCDGIVDVSDIVTAYNNSVLVIVVQRP